MLCLEGNKARKSSKHMAETLEHISVQASGHEHLKRAIASLSLFCTKSYSGKCPLGCSSMCRLSWLSGPGSCSSPGFHLGLIVSLRWHFAFRALGHLLGSAARSSPTTRAKTGRTAQVCTTLQHKGAYTDWTSRIPPMSQHKEAEKAHETLAHKTLSDRPGHRSSRLGTWTKRSMFLGFRG